MNRPPIPDCPLRCLSASIDMSKSVRTGVASRVSPPTAPIHLRAIASGLHLRLPLSVGTMLGLLDPLHLPSTLNAGTCSGSCELTLNSGGGVRFAGRVHNSGGLAAAYTVISSIPLQPSLGGPLLIKHKGHVAGTFAFGSRDDSWDRTTTSATVANNWVALKQAAHGARTDFGTGTGAIQLLNAIAAGATGAWVIHL
jgi:hypothetical protein